MSSTMLPAEVWWLEEQNINTSLRPGTSALKAVRASERLEPLLKPSSLGCNSYVCNYFSSNINPRF